MSEDKHRVGDKSSNSVDNTWANKIVVEIFQDETERKVTAPSAILQVDALPSQKAGGEPLKVTKTQFSQPSQMKFDRVSKNLQSQEMFDHAKRESEGPPPERVSVFNLDNQEVTPFKGTGRGVSQYLVNEDEKVPDLKLQTQEVRENLLSTQFDKVAVPSVPKEGVMRPSSPKHTFADNSLSYSYTEPYYSHRLNPGNGYIQAPPPVYSGYMGYPS